jgi:galactokinase/mevalonate kinase-like predicted kinase
MNANNQLFVNRLTAECDALKASNAELREQLAANTKFISELQHTLRLVQGTHAQQVRECAEKAAQRIGGPTFSALKDPEEIMAEHQSLVSIICEAFGAPVNEYEDALQKAWEARRALGNAPHFVDFRDGFHAAWKLAKGKP